MVQTKPVRDAATLMLVRDSPCGLEVYMLKRPGRGAFPDLHVFPGGKVDRNDEGFDDLCDSLNDATASKVLSVARNGLRYWIAAIRECFEECGVLLARLQSGNCPLAKDSDLEKLIESRDSVARDELNFKDFLDSNQLIVETSRVHYFSHWITPEFAPARFNARFFVTEMPKDQHVVEHESEVVSGEWIRPKQALGQFAAGEWQMIVPTLTSLRMLCGYTTTKDLIASVHLGSHKIPVTPSLHAQGIQYDPNRW